MKGKGGTEARRDLALSKRKLFNLELFGRELVTSKKVNSCIQTAFFDLETQNTFQELGMKNRSSRDPKKLKLAIAGILINKKCMFFEEKHVAELFKMLDQVNLIVGHNLIGFDYLVLQQYSNQDVVKKYKKKTFDIMLEFAKKAYVWVPLDELCRRNLGMEKTLSAIEIPKLWRNGNLQEVKKYLRNDLKMIEAIYNYAKENKKLRYRARIPGIGDHILEINVNW